MASGQVVGLILGEMPPGASAAALTARVGGSTPAESVLVWAFDAATAEYLDLKVMLDGYDGGGLTVTLIWSAATATSGNVVWGVAIRAMPDDAENIGTSHTYDYNAVTAGAPSASGEVAYDTITFTNGADMDSWADGQAAVVRVRRDAANGSDTMTGDAELWGVVIRET